MPRDQVCSGCPRSVPSVARSHRCRGSGDSVLSPWTWNHDVGDEGICDFLIDGNLKSNFLYLQTEALQTKQGRNGMFNGSVFA